MFAITVAASVVVSLVTVDTLSRWRRNADLRKRWSERPTRRRRVWTWHRRPA
jgi:hypothetical protein